MVESPLRYAGSGQIRTHGVYVIRVYISYVQYFAALLCLRLLSHLKHALIMPVESQLTSSFPNDRHTSHGYPTCADMGETLAFALQVTDLSWEK